LLDESYSKFIGQHLEQIEDRFRGERWPSTHAELNRLKVERAKEMFG
jgi:hypothetical protein